MIVFGRWKYRNGGANCEGYAHECGITEPSRKLLDEIVYNENWWGNEG
jgi:hypothetical protein